MRHAPTIQGDSDGDQNRHLHQVLQQEVWTAQKARRKWPKVEVIDESAREHLDDLDRKDREAPEDEKVHPPRRLLADARARAGLGLNNFFCEREDTFLIRCGILSMSRRALSATPASGAASCVRRSPSRRREQR
jgi:hypothetical protein